METYEGFEIRIVDGGGRPLEAILSDTTFYVELLVPHGWKDPGNRVEIDFETSSGGLTGWGDSED